MQKSKLALKILVLVTLIATVSLGWLAGHIVRFSIPEYQFQHPPIEEINPQIKTGYQFEFEGIRRLIVLPGLVPQAWVYSGKGQIDLWKICEGNTYYTSLPAKCRSVDGRLVRVGESQWEYLVVPMLELEE